MSFGKTATAPAIAFVGKSGSGKTTLIEKAVSELCSRGYRVGTVKHHSHVGFEIDREGKDSYRHVQAGSSHAVIASPDKIASIRKLDHELSFDEIIATMGDSDIVVVEGYRHAGLPTIEVFREGVSGELKIDSDEIVALATDIDLAAHGFATNLPVFALNDVRGVVDFMLFVSGLAGGDGLEETEDVR